MAPSRATAVLVSPFRSCTKQKAGRATASLIPNCDFQMRLSWEWMLQLGLFLYIKKLSNKFVMEKKYHLQQNTNILCLRGEYTMVWSTTVKILPTTNKHLMTISV